jgi:hypothetical protein
MEGGNVFLVKPFGGNKWHLSGQVRPSGRSSWIQTMRAWTAPRGEAAGGAASGSNAIGSWLARQRCWLFS